MTRCALSSSIFSSNQLFKVLWGKWLGVWFRVLCRKLSVGWIRTSRPSQAHLPSIGTSRRRSQDPASRGRRMISQKDLRISYAILYVLSKLSILPIDFDRRTGKEKASASGLRWAFWYIWFICGALYSLYCNIRLAQSFLFREDYVEDHLAFHIQIATFSAVGTFWAYRIRICHPQVDIAIFNQLFQRDEGAEYTSGGSRKQYTTQEKMILILPFCLFVNCSMVFMTFYLYDSLSIQFLYILVPPAYRSPGLIPIFLLMETAMLEFYLATAYQSIFLQVLFFQNSMEGFKHRMSFIHSQSFLVSPRRIYKECMICRQMQLNINLFNDMNCDIIFAVKVYWLTVAIDNYFFGIKFLGSKPVLAVAIMFLAIFHTCLFSIMYDTAFSVPRTMQQYKDAVHLVSQKLENGVRRAEVKRILDSIPQVGVKVGSFHTLERVSTPNFVGYIAEKVSALLITSM